MRPKGNKMKRKMIMSGVGDSTRISAQAITPAPTNSYSLTVRQQPHLDAPQPIYHKPRQS